ncbi:MAG: glycosyltransferase [Flavobacteriales bacterium]
MNKIKVIHILNSVGGVDVSLRLILENTNPQKIENIVIHGKEDTKKPFYDKNLKPIKEFKLPIQREISVLKDLSSILKTIKILKKEQPNIIHAHSAKGGIIARAASLFFNVNVLHTPQAYSFLSTKGIKSKLFLIIEKIFKSCNSILLASSTSELNRGIKEVGYKKEKALLFNNSINKITVNPSDKIQAILPKKFICSVGRPSYQKNIEMMVEVVKKVKNTIPNIHLVLMGVGEYSPNKEQVEKLIKKNQLENNFTLIPWIAREEIFKIIAKSDLYISTARYEGLPYSLIESLAIGKASVVTNCDGNRDLVKNNKNGFVVELEDIEAMAKEIIKLLKDTKLRKEFETKSLNYFNTNFNMENNINKLEGIYLKYSS